MALERVQAAWHQAAIKNAPEGNLELLELYVDDIKARIEELTAPPPEEMLMPQQPGPAELAEAEANQGMAQEAAALGG